MQTGKKDVTPKERPVQAVVFDAYGTLFDVSSVVAALDRHFPGQGPAVSAGWRAKQLQYSWIRSLTGQYEDFWRVTEDALTFTCNDMKLSCDAAVRAQLMDSYLHVEPFSEVKQALKSLSGRPLAILSNGTLKMVRAAVNHAGLKGVFSQIISVDELRIFKPSPAVYSLAVQKLGMDKGDIAFVSSNFWDVAGGKSFGFRTFWVNRAGAPADELGIKPEAMLDSLGDLVAALRA